jgi:hypothetical protein
VYVSINLNDDRLVCRISSNLIFFSSLWFSRLRGERNRFFFFRSIFSLSFSAMCFVQLQSPGVLLLPIYGVNSFQDEPLLVSRRDSLDSLGWDEEGG